MNLIDINKEKFMLYYNFLVEENEKYNLTAITNEKEVYIKHFEDSLLMGETIDLNKPLNICDVGSGAGAHLGLDAEGGGGDGKVVDVGIAACIISQFDAVHSKTVHLNGAQIAATGDCGTGPSGSTIGRGEGRHLLAGLYPRHFLHAAVQYRGDDV